MRLIKSVFAVFSLSSMLLAADFRFVRIDVPGAIDTVANTINARGDIVGFYDGADGVQHGFLLSKGTFTTIDYPDASGTVARSINARGDVVGFFFDANFDIHGYLLRDGRFTQIDYPGASATFAQGVNNVGDITGFHVGNDGIKFGFLLKNGEFHNVVVPGSRNCGTDEWMIQDNGWRAVGDFCLDIDGSVHGFVRERTGEFHAFSFPGGTYSCTAAHYINESGDIVGRFILADTPDECDNGSFHGFLLHRGEYVAIDPSGSTDTIALAVNDDGVIVGRYLDNQGNAHGFKAIPKEQHFAAGK